VQYFQRARFELHPENTDPRYQVLLGLLGTQFHVGEPPALRLNDGQRHYFAETGHNVSALFYAYWQAHGGLFVNGFPISEAFSETSPTDHKPYTVQYFQRERLRGASREPAAVWRPARPAGRPGLGAAVAQNPGKGTPCGPAPPRRLAGAIRQGSPPLPWRRQSAPKRPRTSARWRPRPARGGRATRACR
jgi:hypothetical protein